MDTAGTDMFDLASRYICETGVSVFLTGKAGTGKTTFLHRIVKETFKRCIVVAPTGVAAVNAGGVTIHSFFSLPLCPYLPDVKELVTEYQLPENRRYLRREKADIIRTLDLLIIDEISMVRADLLDAVDDMLRRTRRNQKPFGGVQLLMIGDLQQLPPVVTDDEKPYLARVYPSPFFFNSKALQKLSYVTIELDKVFRQQDQAFIDVLNDLRNNKFSPRTQKALQSRYIPGFEAPEDEDGWIRLTTHNRQADSFNQRKLNSLEGELFEFDASIDGNFPETSAPVDTKLQLKVGSQVMFARNDREGRYYNGKIGIVESIEKGLVRVRDHDGNLLSVERECWENLRYEINEDDNTIVQVSDGTFTQYPLRPAWAITIHKSQGLTFDKVIIDAAWAFSFGQVYVALSRCRTLEGIVLTSPISNSCIFDNDDISAFNASFPTKDQVFDALEPCSLSYKIDTLCEAFDLQPLRKTFNPLYKIYHLNLQKVYPKQEETFSKIVLDEIRPMAEVADKFLNQIRSLALKPDTLAERVAKASAYFAPRLEDMASRVVPLLFVEIDNTERKKEFSECTKTLLSVLGLTLTVQKAILADGFDVRSYQKIKVDCLLNKTARDWKKILKGKPAPQQEKKSDEHDVYADNHHPDAVQALIAWRTKVCKAADIPAYCILHQSVLLRIADHLPLTKEEFLSINGFGKAKWEKYGAEILSVLEPFRSDSKLV